MEHKELTGNRHIFLVKFLWRGYHNVVITNSVGKTLLNIKNDSDPATDEIDFIKVFNNASCKFERISKKDILLIESFNTESFEYLKNHYYFSKVKTNSK